MSNHVGSLWGNDEEQPKKGSIRATPAPKQKDGCKNRAVTVKSKTQSILKISLFFQMDVLHLNFEFFHLNYSE